MKIRLFCKTACLCILLTGAVFAVHADTPQRPRPFQPHFSFTAFVQLLESKLPYRSHAEKEQDRLSKCAKLQLTADTNKKFYQATIPLTKQENWLLLVDPHNVLAQDYQPKDLVTHKKPGWPKPTRLRKEAMEHMLDMIAAAKKDGITLVPISTYRTWSYQKMLNERNPQNPYVARPGESQHHLGTAVDFNTLDPKDENIPALVWLREHAGEYGFSLSFPKGATAEKESEYPYEAWHYRYITREAVQLQDDFFGGDQHKTLKFLNDCVFNVQPTK